MATHIQNPDPSQLQLLIDAGFELIPLIFPGEGAAALVSVSFVAMIYLLFLAQC